VLRIPHNQLMDCCGPAGCVMVAFMRTRCLATGCCSGRIYYMSGTQEAIQFPSQIVELCTGLILAVVILGMFYKGKGHGRLYAWFMILYGITRFILNYFRGDQSLFILGMTPGHFWSIISVLIGVIWLFIIWKKKAKPYTEDVVRSVY
ncbi:MAG: prolipoprotein diacylglyceryl transferase, partial [Firmicutes bacterium]|nr:prolipoprotein diacylglyceryl transferase [Bacillota bacterium]